MTQTAQELRFSHDAQGRIVFNGQPYLYLSAGSLPEGQRRAEQKAAWLNECLDAAIKAQLTETRKELDMWRNDATAVCYEAQQAGLYLSTHTRADEVMRYVLGELQAAQQSRARLVGLVREYKRQLIVELMAREIGYQTDTAR